MKISHIFTKWRWRVVNFSNRQGVFKKATLAKISQIWQHCFRALESTKVFVDRSFHTKFYERSLQTPPSEHQCQSTNLPRVCEHAT